MAPVPSLWPLRFYGPIAISLAFAPLWPQCHLFGLCASMAPVPSLWPLRLYGASAISLAFALLWPHCHLFGLCASMAPLPSLWPLRLYGPSAISFGPLRLYGPSAISLAFAPFWRQCHLFGLCAFMVLVAPPLWLSCLCGHLLWPSAPVWPRTISAAFAPLWPQPSISSAFAPLWPQCNLLWPQCHLLWWPHCHLFGLCAFVWRSAMPCDCPSAISYDCPSCPSAISLAFSPLLLSAIFSWVFASCWPHPEPPRSCRIELPAQQLTFEASQQP